MFQNGSAERNTAVGYSALHSATSGQHNTAIGYASLYSLTTSSQNTAVGYNSGSAVTTGVQNTLMGENSGIVLTTGDRNTIIGRDAGGTITTGDNNLLLGHDAGKSGSPLHITTQDNKVVIGDNNIDGCHVKVDWTVSSDQRDKTDIQDITTGLDFVKQLKPKSFWFKKDRDSDVKHGDKKYGFLAQDILALEGSDPVIINNKDEDSLKYQGSHLIPILVNAIKELSTKVTALEAA